MTRESVSRRTRKKTTQLGNKMNINENVIKGLWLEFKGDLQKTWGSITNDKLDKTKGNAVSIAGLLLQKYGKVQKNVFDRVNEVSNRVDDKINEKAEDIKNALK